MSESQYHFVIMFDGRCMGLTPTEADAKRQVDIYGSMVSDVYKAQARASGNPQAFFERVEGAMPVDYMTACHAHGARLRNDPRNYAPKEATWVDLNEDILSFADEIVTAVGLEEPATFECTPEEIEALRDAMVLVHEEPVSSDEDDEMFGAEPTKTMTCVRGSVSESGFFVPARSVG